MKMGNNMSWGSLGGSQVKKKVSDPLPEFLVDDGVMLGGEKKELPSQGSVSESVSGRTRSHREEEPRKTYGVRVPNPMVIETSHRTIFVSFLFFSIAILMAFGAGFFFGRLNLSTPAQAESRSDSLRPTVPTDSKRPKNAPTKERLEEKLPAGALSDSEEKLEKEENVDSGLEEMEEDEELLD